MEYTNAKFAHRLKVARAEAQMTQEDLANASGVKVATIKSYETGDYTPGFDKVVSMAMALGCTTDSLIGLPAVEER